MSKKIKIAIAAGAVIIGSLALSAFQGTSLTLTNFADYGNAISAFGVAQSGQDATVVIGTTSGNVTLIIPARQ